MMEPFQFQSLARLAAEGDNVAIATRRIEAGGVIDFFGVVMTIHHTVLEGHRFAVRAIAPGGKLLSWGLPFGRAMRAIAPGDYVCNDSMIRALASREVTGKIPSQANFLDEIEPFVLDERSFSPAPPLELAPERRTFQGYRRGGSRGVGTRNFIVILGTTSRTASAAREIAARLQPLAGAHAGVDGIVAVSHTEGGGVEAPNNVLEIHRALSGFMLHPNVGAIVAVDFGVEPVNNRTLKHFMRSEGGGLDHVPHRFVSLQGGVKAGYAEVEEWVRGCIALVASARRTREPLAGLTIGLQCGGSDAFSGISGNPLAGSVVHEVIRNGGAGVLCETDELVGAESYMLRSVRDIDTARSLLRTIERFKDRLAWHGVTAEANPSAGNKLRGLYNIVLKSLGAAHKKDPRSRVEHVIEYGEPAPGPGFHFMNSPGNDLEGIAGQVASGCNLFLFVTGNGSITNFPFVPTIKLTTTTRRHELLIHEMDVNAGRYLDGESMEALTAETLDLVVAAASGEKTKGEIAGHSQVSIWRNWRQTDASRLPELQSRPEPAGRAVLGRDAARLATAHRPVELPQVTVKVYPRGHDTWATERVGLVFPTSLCSTQVARMAAERMNAAGLGRPQGISRFVAPQHTEGCGYGGASMHERLLRTYLGYATHPNVAAALFLEHGCEKIPNDVMRRHLESAGMETSQFGWASVQLDGGIDSALGKVGDWFERRLKIMAGPVAANGGIGLLSIAVQSVAGLDEACYESLAEFVLGAVAAGGTVLVPESDPLLMAATRLRRILGAGVAASLSHGQCSRERGLHIVATESTDFSENLAGLGACGANLAVSAVSIHPREGHPLVPVLQFDGTGGAAEGSRDYSDGLLAIDVKHDLELITGRIAGVIAGNYTTACTSLGFSHFQITRGLLGVSA